MGRIRFHFDGVTRRFYVLASLALEDRGGVPPPSATPWEFAQMIVDTGSNRTAISEDVARAMGVDIAMLDREPIGGVTGVAPRPYLTGVHLRLLGEEAPLLLDRVTVLAENVGQSMGRKPPRTGTNLLGMDVALKLGAKLRLDFGTFVGHMEWS